MRFPEYLSRKTDAGGTSQADSAPPPLRVEMGKGTARYQIALLPESFNDYVDADNPVRVIDP
jgi:hypothetical protein